MLRRIRLWIMWVVVLSGIVWIVVSAQSFQKCVHEHKNGNQYKALHEGSDVLGSLIRRKIARFRLVSYCAVDFTDANEHAITALAGVAVALFTLYLWLTTAGLRHYAGIQARDMRRLLDAAKENANAARSQADAMGQLHAATAAQGEVLAQQAAAIAEQADIARQTLALTHRPRIRVRHVALAHSDDAERSLFEEGQPIEGKITVVNVGGSDASIIASSCHVLIGRAGSPPPWPRVSEEPDSFQPRLSPGAHADIPFTSNNRLSRQEAMNLRNLVQSTVLYVMGRVTYLDGSNVARTTGFCRYWSMPQGTNVARFRRFEDPDFEYED
jgi:hypothetical protein